MYRLSRIFHLLILVSVQPLSFLYLKQSHPQLVNELGGFFILMIISTGFFVSLFYVGFEMRYFPLETNKAYLAVGAMTGNFLAAALTGEGLSFFGAYSVSFRIALSYLAYFSIMLVYFLNKNKREKWFYYTSNWYITLLLLFFIASAVSAILFSIPFLEQLRSEEMFFMQMLCLGALGYDIYISIKNLQTRNMFQFDEDGLRETRDKLLEKWALAVMLLLLVAMAASIVIICW